MKNPFGSPTQALPESHNDRQSIGVLVYGIILSFLFPGLGHWHLGMRKIVSAFIMILALLLSVIDFLYLPSILFKYAQVTVTLSATVLVGIDWRKSNKSHGRAWWAPLLVVTGYFGVFLVLGLIVGPDRLPQPLPIPTSNQFKQTTSSMEPNIMIGDKVHVIHGKADQLDIKRGDILVFRFPRTPQEIWIKRVIGLPGDEVEFKSQGAIFINGKVLPRTVVTSEYDWYVSHAKASEKKLKYDPDMSADNLRIYREENNSRSYDIIKYAKFGSTKHIKVEADAYLFVGDNRDKSYDSRDWGTVPEDLIVGKAKKVKRDGTWIEL